MTNSGLLATKNNGGDKWNCVIIGDKEIPRNRISKWRIKINTNVSNGYYDFYIGIVLVILKAIYIKNAGVFIAIVQLLIYN